jgi:hypothetical protein
LRKLGIRLARSKKPGHIHAPTFGAGLAGGNWNKIEQIIKDEIVNRGIKVTIYKYQRPSRPKRSR